MVKNNSEALIISPGLTIPRENIAYAEWLGIGCDFLYIYLKVPTEKSHIFVGGDKSFAFWEEYTGQRVSWDKRPKADQTSKVNQGGEKSEPKAKDIVYLNGDYFELGEDGKTIVRKLATDNKE
jgi:hypothetical protein